MNVRLLDLGENLQESLLSKQCLISGVMKRSSFHYSIDFFGLGISHFIFFVDEKRSRGLGCLRNEPQRKSLYMDDAV